MIDLSSSYLGLQLKHPLMPGASPLVDDLDVVKRLEDAGAAAIVMHSLFEEQIVREEIHALQDLESHSESFAEAQSYLPSPDEFALGPAEYLEQIRRIKATVGLPVIGSLNGISPGGWLDYGRWIESAGADALELNVYQLATDLRLTAAELERRTVDMVAQLKQQIRIPLAVKLSPFYTALPQFAQQLQQAGAAGVVLFNRFYQPDIDLEELEVQRTLVLSDSSELNLRLRYLAILSGRIELSLGASGGVHSVYDVIKAVMAGAHAVQLVSALLQRGPEYLRVLVEELQQWLEEHEYDSLRQMQGNMSLQRCPDPTAYERGNYVHILQSWRDW
ncbi:MAG TPA: dihydroorotate dehydrogenase-like protein [Acidobacteriota bacterium]|jgi:dihydroorotate dehydrogenase (fumarate)